MRECSTLWMSGSFSFRRSAGGEIMVRAPLSALERGLRRVADEVGWVRCGVRLFVEPNGLECYRMGLRHHLKRLGTTREQGLVRHQSRHSCRSRSGEQPCVGIRFVARAQRWARILRHGGNRQVTCLTAA